MGCGGYMCSQSQPTQWKCFLSGTIWRNLVGIRGFYIYVYVIIIIILIRKLTPKLGDVLEKLVGEPPSVPGTKSPRMTSCITWGAQGSTFGDGHRLSFVLLFSHRGQHMENGCFYNIFPSCFDHAGFHLPRVVKKAARSHPAAPQLSASHWHCPSDFLGTRDT